MKTSMGVTFSTFPSRAEDIHKRDIQVRSKTRSPSRVFV